MLRILLIFSLCFGIASTAFTQSSVEHHVKVRSSEFLIHGSTNVSDYHCKLQESTNTDSLNIKRWWSNKTITFQGLVLQYRVNQFDCGLELMNQDLQVLLKSATYPYLSLQINSIRIKEGKQQIEELLVSSDVTVNLAGSTKNVSPIQGKVINHSESMLTLKGKTTLVMEDFGIEPPVKFFGMVKVESELVVEFSITMEVTDLK
ncbi:MAG: YceI family protein [Marinoscillum sp.]